VKALLGQLQPILQPASGTSGCCNLTTRADHATGPGLPRAASSAIGLVLLGPGLGLNEFSTRRCRPRNLDASAVFGRFWPPDVSPGLPRIVGQGPAGAARHGLRKGLSACAGAGGFH